MPQPEEMTRFAEAGDGVRLAFQETGGGPPVLFLHEFADDMRSWEPQVRRLSRRYRCIAFNARGYPPSDVPEAAERYGQDIAVTDAFAVMDAAGAAEAHLVGHSMGAYTALHMAIRRPDRVRSVTVSGCGWGSAPGAREQSAALVREIAETFETEPIEDAARRYAAFPMRQRFRAKDPRGWAAFARRLAEHSPKGSALTMANVQGRRPTLFEMQAELAEMKPPLLVVVGDEDEACLEGSLMMKRTAPDAGLYVVPWSSHTVNSEEPALFNAALLDFLASVDTGRGGPS